MVNSNWTFTVTHHQKDNSWASTDISADSFPRYFTDTGAEKVNAAKVRIIAQDGQYIQNNVNGKPQIKHNDRVRIIATDGNGGTYNRVFDVIKIIPIKSKSEGVMVELELLGIERWLQKCNYSSRVFAQTPVDIWDDLVSVYTKNRASNGPIIDLSGSQVNELPSVIKIHLDWGNNEDTIFNRMQELVEKMSAPQSSGGVLDFFDIRFVCSASSVTQFKIEVFSSGNSGRSKPSKTLNSTDINTEDTSGGFEEPQGLLLNAWGATGTGSLPTNWSKFNSKVLVMPENLGSKSFLPEYSSSFKYEAGAYVKYTTGTVDKVFKAKTTTQGNTPPNTGNSTYWEETLINAYYDDIQYSPWTDGKKDHWNTSMGNPTASSSGSFTGRRMAFDANLIIADDHNFRTWADVVATNPSTITNSKQQWLYNGNTLYDGFRVFVKGAGAGGTDFSGFSNCIVEYNEGEWIRKYELKEDFMIAVFEDAKVWRYDGGNSYTDMQTKDNGIDCFHPTFMPFSSAIPEGVYNSESRIRNRTDETNIVDFTGNSNSAISATYRWYPIENWWTEWDDLIIKAAAFFGGAVVSAVRYSWPLKANGAINTPRVSDSWYSAGAWLCLRFPFPKLSLSNPTVPVGELYGGGTASGQDIVPHFDFENMTYTSDGKKGFNQGSSSEDLGPISSIDFDMKIQYLADWNSPQNVNNLNAYIDAANTQKQNADVLQQQKDTKAAATALTDIIKLQFPEGATDEDIDSVTQSDLTRTMLNYMSTRDLTAGAQERILAGIQKYGQNLSTTDEFAYDAEIASNMTAFDAFSSAYLDGDTAGAMRAISTNPTYSKYINVEDAVTGEIIRQRTPDEIAAILGISQPKPDAPDDADDDGVDDDSGVDAAVEALGEDDLNDESLTRYTNFKSKDLNNTIETAAEVDVAMDMKKSLKILIKELKQNEGKLADRKFANVYGVSIDKAYYENQIAKKKSAILDIIEQLDKMLKVESNVANLSTAELEKRVNID